MHSKKSNLHHLLGAADIREGFLLFLWFNRLWYTCSWSGHVISSHRLSFGATAVQQWGRGVGKLAYSEPVDCSVLLLTLPRLSRLRHPWYINTSTPPTPPRPPSFSIFISISVSVCHTQSELWVRASCGDNVCAALWQWRQQPVCKKRKWCYMPRRSRVPGRNVYPVHCLWSFTVNHFLHTVYELSSSASLCQAHWWHWERKRRGCHFGFSKQSKTDGLMSRIMPAMMLFNDPSKHIQSTDGFKFTTLFVLNCVLMWNGTGHIVWDFQEQPAGVTVKQLCSRLMCNTHTVWFEQWWQFVVSVIQNSCQCYKGLRSSMPLILTHILSGFCFSSRSLRLALLQIHTILAAGSNTTGLTLAHLTLKHLRAFIQFGNWGGAKPHTWQLKLRPATKDIWT